MRLRHLLCVGVLAASACGDNKVVTDAAPHPQDDADIDAMIDGQMIGVDAAIDANPLEPDTLFGTGLCVDQACSQISADVHEYEPQYVLWADTATKRRFIFLPPGTQIDTSDMNHWVFPKGTKIWKEFTRDGVRVETRYIAKLVDDVEDPTAVSTPWFYISYQWNSSPTSPLGDDTVAVTQGAQNVNGTQHDIPSRSQCKGCHERVKPGRVLGFGAMSLDFTDPNGLLDLDGLITADLLTSPPAGAKAPHFPLPADATAQDKAAMGYVHANCGHCHNPSSDIFHNITPLDLRLDVTKLTSRLDTGLYATTIGKPGATITDNSDGNCNTITDPAGVGGCTNLVVPDWATTTSYSFNDRVVKGGNAYVCTRNVDDGNGNAHSCGISVLGPSGTGTGIVDGTATWNFIGDPKTRSLVEYRYQTTNFGRHMPAAGTEMTDPDGDAILTAWLNQLP